MSVEGTVFHDQSATVFSGGPENATAFSGGSLPSTRIDPSSKLEKGSSILGLYQVLSDPFEGGMGCVFKVHHQNWDVDLALKRPHAELFETEEQKALFTKECESWIGLGLHPHIVSCYYVREIDGVPSIFSEWMDGGSLADQIKQEKLYKGSIQEQQARILDIAIQYAWGLRYAHECGLIHQDVKPDNVLLTADGTVKAADFGIANARFEAGISNKEQSTGTILSEGGAYTAEYCSPEQMKNAPLTKRTDIWSWAVTLLEMYVGEQTWTNGVVAGYGCREYFEQARLAIPSEIQALFIRCFAENEAERPYDFAEIEQVLISVYEAISEKAYPRSIPRAASETADSLNNRGLSFLDIGKLHEAERLFTDALRKDPNHAEALYNLLLHQWREGKVKDKESVIRRMNEVVSQSRTWRPSFMLGLLHFECGDREQALALLERALEDSQGDASVAAALSKVKGTELPLVASYEMPLFDRSVLSLDGKLLLTAQDRDKKLQLFDVITGESMGAPADLKQIHYEDIQLAGDGVTASVVFRAVMRVFDMRSGEMKYTLSNEKNPDTLHMAQLNKDASLALIVTGKHDGSGFGSTAASTKSILTVFDLREGTTLFEKEIYGIAMFAGNGQFVCIQSSHYGSAKKFIDAHTGEAIDEPQTIDRFASSRLQGKIESPDGAYRAEGTIGAQRGRKVKIFDVATETNIQTFHKRSDDSLLQCFAMTPEGKLRLAFWGKQKLDVFDYDLDALHRNAEGMLCRITTTKDVEEQASQTKTLCAEALSAEQQGDILRALSLLEQVRTIPNYLNEPSFFTTSRALGRHCGKADVINHRPQSMLEPVATSSVKNNQKVDITWWDDILVSTNGAGSLFLFNFITGERKDLLFTNIGTGPTCVDPFDKQLIVSDGSVARLVNAENGSVLMELKGHTDEITTVCMNGRGKAATAAYDNTIRIWDLKKGKCVAVHEKIGALRQAPSGSIVKSPVIRMQISPDGKHLVHCKASDSVYLNAACTPGQERKRYVFRTLSGSETIPQSMGFSISFDGQFLIGGSYLWPLCSPNRQEYAFPNLRSSSGACLSKDNTLAFFVSLGQLYVFSLPEKTLLYQAPTEMRYSLCLSPDESILAGKGEEGIHLVHFDWTYQYPKQEKHVPVEPLSTSGSPSAKQKTERKSGKWWRFGK